jgi:excisionase family DNA binding protein
MTPPRHGRSRSPRSALYVRIPLEHAEALDRVAYESGRHKQEVVADLLARFIENPPPEEGWRRVAIDDSDLVVGHHAFKPYESEVLSLEQAAELLQIDVEVMRDLAEAGELPGRRLGDEWRFARRALIDWLAGGPAESAR